MPMAQPLGGAFGFMTAPAARLPMLGPDGTYSFVASGTIASAGLFVALRSDGNVEVAQAASVPEGAGSPVVFESADSYYFSATTVGTDKVVIAYRDNGNSGYGTAIVYQPAYTSTNADSWIGASQASATNGQSVTVDILGGVNTHQTGMTTGATYYLADNGTLTTVMNSRKVGRALSATKILIERA